MNKFTLTLRQIVILPVVLGAAATAAGCGRTLAFVDHDGVNFAIRANASSSPPLEANFGLNRTVAAIVPPAGENGGQPDGNAVNMLAAFDVNYKPDEQKAFNGTLTIDNQFASGTAAKNIATTNPEVAAQITRIGASR